MLAELILLGLIPLFIFRRIRKSYLKSSIKKY